MPHVLLVIMVWFMGTGAAGRPPQIEVAKAPEGLSVAACETVGRDIVAKARKLEGVQDAAFACVTMVERIAS